MRLSPEACRRTFVRSKGLIRREGKALELEGEWGTVGSLLRYGRSDRRSNT
jgi:hypothetical protein